MPLWPSVLVTTTSTVPAACAGVVAVMEVLLTTVTPVAAVPPSFTLAPDKNPVPVMVTAVPPLAEPEMGEMAVTVAAGLGGGLDPLERKVAICMTQLLELVVAVAL